MRTMRLTILVAACCAATAAQAQLIPINDLGAGTYNGFQGGLYPGGLNSPPAAHLNAAMSAAAQITPLSNPGVPGSPAVIGVLSVGMSNTHQEWADFERRADATVHRNARVVVVNGAVGGMTASDIDDPAAGIWQIIAQRLSSLGLSAQQVQVVWLKEADQNPGAQFPLRANELKSELRTIVQILHDKYPNLKLCYLSSRIFGGYNAGGEPYAYHTGFAVKWLIEDQINGDPGLNHDPSSGPVEAPVLLWGPYLWAEGMNPRSDGLTWAITDLEADRTHPAEAGEQKVGQMLLSFFSSDPSAQPWWPRQPGWRLVSLPVSEDATVSAASPDVNFGSTATLACTSANPRSAFYLKFNMAGITRPAAFVKLGLRAATNPTSNAGGLASVVADSGWAESSITFSNAPASSGAACSMSPSSRDGTCSGEVSAATNADTDGVFSLRVTGLQSAALQHRSRETADPARLVFTLPYPLPGDLDADGHVNTADLVIMLGQFGQVVLPNTYSDVNGDGVVNTADLVALLASFGA